MKGNETINEHEKFKELAACATANALTDIEWVQLTGHLLVCRECEQAYQQYRSLATGVIPLLAVQYGDQGRSGSWDIEPLRTRLFERLKSHSLSSQWIEEPQDDSGGVGHRRFTHFFAPVWAAAVLCLVAIIGFVAYRSHYQKPVVVAQIQSSVPAMDGQKSMDELTRLLDVQKQRVSELDAENLQKQQSVDRLTHEVKDLDGRITEFDEASRIPWDELQRITRERDSLAAQLLDAKKAYEETQAELVTVRSDRDELVRRTGLLESKLREVSATASNQEDRLAEYERYMASDRDIRELMGARKLYIADVFDVNGYSRTQKAFGRIFYTEGKSLIFYAFDLDDRRESMNASAFQVWGKSEEVSNPVNLGILYMDNESNRRWLLRVDDPAELARINSVFVTVEPRGGSRKPTGKPFLYALLWQKANHP
jgi:hypothetical protein